MDLSLPALRRDERIALKLRALYERMGYTRYVMGSFEEYDLYMQNRAVLSGDDIITFTGADGRLMALRPDVTLSIVKNTKPGDIRRVYYNENVFRRSRKTREYREIEQIGLEFIGGEGSGADAEVLKLAAESLSAAGESVLDLSHMGFIEAMLAPFGELSERDAAKDALGDKSPHRMCAAAKSAGLSEQDAERMAALCELSGPFEEAMQKARALAADNADASAALDDLEQLWAALNGGGCKAQMRLDFSILNDIDYYNGLIFQGYIKDTPHMVLAGGRYDNLMARFDKPQGAVGFALYLDELGRAREEARPEADGYLNIALPKGRMGDDVYRMFERAGLCCPGVLDESRKLIFEDGTNRVRYLLVKPTDVDSYVEHGTADIGVVGKDVLMESGADVLELMDMKLGACRLAVAGRPDFEEDLSQPLRVATKYPAVARRYYAGKSRAVEVIKLHGSIELAPLTGLADVIVDIVESGSTLRENNLAVLAEIAPSSARLIANRAAWRFKESRIRDLLKNLEDII